MALVECVPNFSEGRDAAVISEITKAITAVNGITLLDTDPGKDTNRTVVTFVGEPAAVEEAAFQGIRKAAELIDMRTHSGAHPRMGATDVCPFIPISGISIAECVELSRRVGERVGLELDIPVYLYEKSAKTPDRQNLALIREGEYEGLDKKLQDPRWKPDFGPAKMNVRSGATITGCREFLIAYNINLNTRDKRLATDIAFDLREKGRSIRRPVSGSKNQLDGDIIRYEKGEYPCSFCEGQFMDVPALTDHTERVHGFKLPEFWTSIGYAENNLIGKAVKRPGLFSDVKAIGWYIEEFNRAQISINFTNFKAATIHDVFDRTCVLAESRGVRVTGSELVGLIPLEAMLMAGRHYLEKQQSALGVPEDVMVETAIQSLGLREIAPFNVREKIIDYAVGADSMGPLARLTTADFVRECSLNTPVPGGGSVAALAAGLGAALTAMVAALSHEKLGFFAKKPLFDEIGMEAQQLKDSLLALVDEDSLAFSRVMEAKRLPGESPAERDHKSAALQAANRYAVEIPLKVAEKAGRVMELALQMVHEGNPNSVSDSGVAGEVGYAALRGAILNVKINLAGMKSDSEFCKSMLEKTQELLAKADRLHDEIFRETIKIIDGENG